MTAADVPAGPGAAPRSRRSRRRRMRNFAFSFLIILATVFFALGVMLPAIRFTTVFVWTNQHSVATIIWALWKNEEFFLCFVIFMFSIFFPFMKLFYLLTLVTSPDMPAEFRNKSISAMEWLGRYSMTDVMVLALMIFYINASGYSEASVLPGIYFFAASAIMTMLAYGWANSVTPGLPAPKPVSLQARLAKLARRPGQRRIWREAGFEHSSSQPERRHAASHARDASSLAHESDCVESPRRRGLSPTGYRTPPPGWAPCARGTARRSRAGTRVSLAVILLWSTSM